MDHVVVNVPAGGRRSLKLFRRGVFFFSFLLLTGFFLVLNSFTLLFPVEKLSMLMTAKSLKDGKSIIAKGEIYYQVAGGTLVTRFNSPFEYLVITNAQGEYRIYNTADNTLTQAHGKDFSSENSYIYYFLHGKTQDMGLSSAGFHIRDTKFEEKMVITTWDPPDELLNQFAKVELVQENYRPIFMGFYDSKDKPVQKIFYSQYQKVGDYSLPFSITEFQYSPKGDSIITKRTYSDLKTNEQVDNTWLNFKIPANAKILKQ